MQVTELGARRAAKERDFSLKLRNPVTVLPLFPTTHARPPSLRTYTHTHNTLYINISFTCARDVRVSLCTPFFALFS